MNFVINIYHNEVGRGNFSARKVSLKKYNIEKCTILFYLLGIDNTYHEYI